MASIQGVKLGTDSKNSRNLTVEEIVPSSGWTEDSTSHCLLIDLPGFKKDDVKLQVDTHGQIIAHGERQVSENKYVRFEQKFKTPEDSNIEEISGRFEDEILYVTVPKQVIERKEEHENVIFSGVEEEHKHENPDEGENLDEKDEKHENDHGHHDENGRIVQEEVLHEGNRKEWRQEPGLLGSLVKKLGKNKGIVIMAVLAFSIGVWVSQKLQSSGNCEEAF